MHSKLSIWIGIILMTQGTLTAAPLDLHGAPLPDGAIQRLGTLEMRYQQVGGLAYLPGDRGVILVEGEVEIWDLAAGQQLSRTPVADSYLVSVQVRRDGQCLLLADQAGTVREWDPATLMEIRSWPTGQQRLLTACYSPDETRVLTAANSAPHLKEWDLESGRELIALTSQLTAVVAGAIYGPGGRTAIIGGGYEHNLEHWDLSSGEMLKAWSRIYSAKHMALSPDEKSVTVGLEDRAVEWSLETYEALHTYKHVIGEAARIFQVGYLPTTDEVLCGGRDGTIHRWSRATGERVFHWRPHQSIVAPFAISSDEQWLLSFGTGQVADTSIITGLPRRPVDRHEGSIEAAAFVPGTDQVVTGSSDETLRIWDARNGKTVRVIPGAQLGAFCLAVSADGQQVAAGCKDGLLRVYDLADGRLRRELAGHFGYIRAVCFDQAGWLYSSADDGSIRLWEPEQTEATAVLQGHQGGVLGLAVTPDGRMLVSGGRDCTVRCWDLNTREQIHLLKGHQRWVTKVRLLPSSRHALSADLEGRVLQWDLESGQQVTEINVPYRIHDMVTTPDGRSVIVSGDYTLARAFNLGDRQLQAEFGNHSQAIPALAIDDAGELLLTGSTDTTALLWDLKLKLMKLIGYNQGKGVN